MTVCRRCGGSGIEPSWKQMGTVARMTRKEKGLTLREAAERAGITAAYACDLEHGRRPWGGDGAIRYREVLALRGETEP